MHKENWNGLIVIALLGLDKTSKIKSPGLIDAAVACMQVQAINKVYYKHVIIEYTQDKEKVPNSYRQNIFVILNQLFPSSQKYNRENMQLHLNQSEKIIESVVEQFHFLIWKIL